MKFACLAVFALFSLSLAAQDGTTEESYLEVPRLPEGFRKNAIGLNITPVMIAAMGEQPRTPRFSAMYKRQSLPNRAWRVSLFADITDDVSDDDGVLTVIRTLTDTSIAYLWEEDQSTYFSARFGYEWSDPEKAVTPIYGLDVFAGVHYLENAQGTATYARDTTAQSIRPDLRTGDLVLEEDYSEMQYHFGVAASIGWRFRMKEKWEFVAQLSPEVSISPYQRIEDHLTLRSYDGGRTLVEFRTRLLECYLFYRF